MHIICDNGAGNSSTKSRTDRYLSTVPEMRTLVHKIFGLGSGIRAAPSLWTVMSAQQSQSAAVEIGRLYLICES